MENLRDESLGVSLFSLFQKGTNNASNYYRYVKMMCDCLDLEEPMMYPEYTLLDESLDKIFIKIHAGRNTIGGGREYSTKITPIFTLFRKIERLTDDHHNKMRNLSAIYRKDNVYYDAQFARLKIVPKPDLNETKVKLLEMADNESLNVRTRIIACIYGNGLVVQFSEILTATFENFDLESNSWTTSTGAVLFISEPVVNLVKKFKADSRNDRMFSTGYLLAKYTGECYLPTTSLSTFHWWKGNPTYTQIKLSC